MIGRKASWGLPLKPAGHHFATPDDADDGKKRTETALKFLVSEAEKLEPKQRDLFLRGADPADPGTYDDYVTTLSAALKGTIDTSRVSRLTKKMKPIYLLVKSIHPLLASAGQINPMPASLILGGITCVVSFANRVEEYQSKLVDLLGWMGDEIDLINDYRKENLFDDDHHVRACEINIAADILQLCVKAAKKFYNDEGKERNSIVMALKAQIKDFDATFGEIKSQFRLHLSALKNRRDMANTRRMKMINAGVHNMSEFIDRSSKERCDNVEEENRRRWEEQARDRAEIRRQFLEWLPSIDFNGIQDDNLARRVSGSGDWLMRHDSFKAWIDDTHSALLWIHGKHGSGKSHLAARAIEELRALTAKTPGSTVAYLYCTSNLSSSANMHLNSMLGSLFAQLCRSLPRDEEVEDLIPREGGYSSKDSPRRSELKAGIVELVSKFRPCFIVVDGLDECSHWEDVQFQELCSFIAELSRPAELSTKVLVLSRPNYPYIEKALADSAKIQVDSGFNSNDIQAYISKRVSEIRPDQTEEESEGLEEIKKLLLDQSDGMFLWARLKINDLEGSMEDMKEALETSSENLDDLYRKKVNDILRQSSRPARDRALRALLWITTACRPLSKVELIEALSIKGIQKGLDSRTRLPVYQPICRECADLVVENNGTYSLIHASLGEFLTREFLSLHEYTILQNPSATLAEACLKYLNFDAFRTISVASPEELEETQTRYPLLEYASHFWASHFSAAKTDDVSLALKDQVLDFLQNEFGMRVSLQALYPAGFRYNIEANKPNALHVIAAFNLPSLIEVIPNWKTLLNDKDHISFRPIDYAILESREEAIVWLLDAYKEAQNGDLLIKALSEDCRFNILHRCATENWHRAASRLLSLGYDCNRLDQWGRTPLHLAAWSGSVESLEILLNAGANVTAISIEGNDTPLTLAAWRGHVGIMARLLESLPETTEQPTTHMVSEGMTTKVHQADQNDTSVDSTRTCTPRHGVTRSAYLECANIHGLSALLCACGRVQTRAAEFLLDHGADIRAKTRTKFNVFHFAAREGGAELIKALSSRSRRVEPSMIDARNNLDYTPLQYAVAMESSAAAIALLEAGAQPSLRSVGTFSALTLAIANGCYDVAEMLMTTYGVDATETEDDLKCAVTMAAEKGWLKVFELLPGNLWGDICGRFSSTLLHCAAFANQVEFIKTLHSLVPDLDLVPRRRWDQTPWHDAARSGALDALAWISNVMPSALLLKGFKSRLPIHHAAYSGQLDCVKVLLTEHPATIDAEDSERATPLALAAYQKQFAVVEYLAENGANIDATDEYGATCVALALIAWDTRIAKYLLGRGAKCRTVESDGDTLLHYAATTGDLDLVRQLLENECDPLVQGFRGRTALMQAVRTGWSEVTKLLLSRKPEASEMRDEDGRTCIHLACYFASTPEILQTLLDHNPELLLSVDHRGFDAMDFAAIEGRPDLVAVLVDNGMPLTGSPESPWSPMDMAGSEGSIAVLNDLIKRGISVNNDQSSLEDGGDGLTHASYLARDATATLLFKHGADPTVKDIFGLCALDYASNNHVLQKVFASPLRTHQVMDRKSQLVVLRQTIVDSSKKLASTKPGSDRKLPNYGSILEILAEALLLFRTESSVRHSKVAFRALLKTDNKKRVCRFCSGDISSTAFSICRDYRRCEELCSPCHDNCLSPSGYSSIPISPMLLDELGRSLQPAIAVLESFRPADILSLSLCLRSASLFQHWIGVVLGIFTDCEYLNQPSSAISAEKISTWRLLNLFWDVRNFDFLPAGEGTDVQKRDQEDFILSACYTLWTTYGTFRPNTEKPRLVCRGHAHIQVADLKSVSEENEQYIDAEGVLHQRFYEDIARYYSDLRLDEIADFIESQSAPPSESEIAEEYENLRDAIGPGNAAFLACFISQESAKKEIEKAFNEIWSKARPLLQQLENSDGNDVELEDVKRKVRAYEIAWSTAQAILHVPPKRSLQEIERRRRQMASQKKDAEKRDEANLEELETMKSPQRTFTIESRDEYDTASERSARESWKSAGEYLENDQVSDGSGDDQEIGWETCSES